MSEKPILFSGEMIRALLDGRKTQTRRVVTPQPDHPYFASRHMLATDDEGIDLYLHSATLARAIRCPYGKPSDRLWVRETWSQPTTLDPGPTFYRADYPACVPAGFENIPPAEEITWKPSIHMPRKLSRVTLEVAGVRVERLQDISEADAIAEGVPQDKGVGTQFYRSDPRNGYKHLWDGLNAARGYGWDVNPWVWVVEFRRVMP